MTGHDRYSKKNPPGTPGAITSIIKDVNNDGLNDIIALLAQGDEGVFLYTNKGKGDFSEKKLLSFSPLNGSQYIELADFNKDGFDDLMYVCGDNADRTPFLKTYHGVYIFRMTAISILPKPGFINLMEPIKPSPAIMISTAISTSLPSLSSRTIYIIRKKASSTWRTGGV